MYWRVPVKWIIHLLEMVILCESKFVWALQVLIAYTSMHAKKKYILRIRRQGILHIGIHCPFFNV